jgi:hypothetical protein
MLEKMIQSNSISCRLPPHILFLLWEERCNSWTSNTKNKIYCSFFPPPSNLYRYVQSIYIIWSSMCALNASNRRRTEEAWEGDIMRIEWTRTQPTSSSTPVSKSF